MNVNHSNLWSIGWRMMGKSDYFWWLIFTSQHIPNTTIVCTLSKLITGTKRLEKSCSPKHSQELSTKSIQKCYEINNGFFGYRRDNHTKKINFLFVQVYKTLLLGHILPRSHFQCHTMLLPTNSCSHSNDILFQECEQPFVRRRVAWWHKNGWWTKHWPSVYGLP